MAKTLTWSPDKLPDIVAQCVSMDQILRMLGLNLTGGNRDTVKRYIKKLNICTKHMTGQGHRKGCVTPVKPAIPLTEILVENSTYRNTHNLKERLIRAGLKEHKCEVCNLTEWLGKLIPIELHHCNGINDDHRLENLEILCPNCHAITDTYRAKNIK